MLRDRYDPMNLFTLVPTLSLALEPVLAQLDRLLEDDWRWRPLAEPLAPAWRRWLVIRRRGSAPTARRASGVWAPQDPALEEVVRVAGTRGVLAPRFAAATGEVGLDHDEVRRGTGWSRHRTLALGALALLTGRRAGAMAVELVKKTLPSAQERRSLAAFKASRGLTAR